MSEAESVSPGRAVIKKIVVPLMAMVIAFGAGWTVGAGRQNIAWADGAVTVSDNTITVKVGETTVMTNQPPAWVASSGAWHETGWPDCLGTLGTFEGTLPVVVTTSRVDGQDISTLLAIKCEGS
jgi:hypothetical protein